VLFKIYFVDVCRFLWLIAAREVLDVLNVASSNLTVFSDLELDGWNTLEASFSSFLGYFPTSSSGRDLPKSLGKNYIKIF